MTGLCRPGPLRSVGKGCGLKSDLRRVLSKQRQLKSLDRAGLDRMEFGYWWLTLIWVSSVAAYTNDEQTLLNFAAKVDNFQVI